MPKTLKTQYFKGETGPFGRIAATAMEKLPEGIAVLPKFIIRYSAFLRKKGGGNRINDRQEVL